MGFNSAFKGLIKLQKAGSSAKGDVSDNGNVRIRKGYYRTL